MKPSSCLLAAMLLFLVLPVVGQEAAPPSRTLAATAGPALAVDVSSSRHAISPYVYGINYNQPLINDLRLPLTRWGGDATSEYNWQIDSSDSGSDWYFEVFAQSDPTSDPGFDPSQLPNNSAFDRFVQTNQQNHAATIGTIPIMGWVANTRVNNTCGFSVAKYGKQQQTDPYHPDCGNGILPDGQTPITQAVHTDPNDTDMQVGPQFMSDWVTHVVNQFGSTAQGGVLYWQLDNEPVWWHAVHQAVHPAHSSYDEIWQDGLKYAQAVKAADPTAKIGGPVTAGYSDLFFSAVDMYSGWSTAPYEYWDNPVDRMAHGNMDFAAWYLQQFANYQQQTGQRLLDYFDVHGYMPGTGGDNTDPASDAARFESTRVFWDSSYIFNHSDYLSSECVCLIPRMKNWVAGNYPGTKLAITEYNLGAQQDINGALAEADLLGIFGREGLDVGVLWPSVYPNLSATDAVTYAFRLYRNYDGQGSAFGDTGVSATSADQSTLSVYAAQRSADNSLTIVAVNKTGGDLTSTIALAGFSPGATAQVYRYSAANLTAIVREADQQVTANGVTATFPANSATLFVIESDTPSLTANPNPIPVAADVTLGQTTLTWNAAASSTVEIHVGSATGTLLTRGGSSGSAQTGNWVSDGMQFFLVDASTGTVLASTTVQLSSGGTSGGGGALSASPNPIPVGAGVTLGQTTLTWNAPGSSSVQLHITSATGPLMAEGGTTGSAQTGDWVSNGMVFVLVDSSTSAVLGTTTVTLNSGSGGATLNASPNPIPVNAGVTVGQATLTWNAPGSISVEIHVNSATGPLMAEGGSSGNAQTGDWVTNGMQFFLVDSSTHATLATATVAVGTAGAVTFSASPNPITGQGALGQTTLTWNAPGSSGVQIHVSSATGPLMAEGESSGSAQTGFWVSDGMQFFLVDSTTGATLATVTVGVSN